MPASRIPAPLRQPLADCVACLRFYSRLPLPVFAFETQPHAMLDFSRAIAMLPVAGALLGCIGALALLAAGALHLSPAIAATLAIATMVASTGAMHEDGLADTADGFGGGGSIARKLEIMKDSRIGAYGGAALVLALLLRVEAVAALAERGLMLAALAMIACAAVSRVAGLLPLLLLAPARAEGAGFSAPRPSWRAFGQAAILAAAVALLPLAGGAPSRSIALAGLLAALAAYCVVRLAAAQIKGQTGDVAGAAQQAAEIGFLLGLAAGI